MAVRNLPDLGHSELVSQAIESANRALDLFAATGVVAVNVDDVDAFHGTWLRDGQDIVLRLNLSYPLQVRAMVGGSFTEPDGNLVISPPFGEWHRALRYFRLSQASDDLFDAFRNLYLALESLLNEVAPRKNGEGEGVWLERALRLVYERIDVPTILRELEPGGVDELYKAIWKLARNPVFHAKDDSSSFLPLDISSRESVRVNVLRCARLASSLSEELHGVRFLSSGVSIEAGKAMCERLLSGSDIALADDPTPFEPDNGEVSPAGRSVFTVGAHPVDAQETTFDACIRGRASTDEVVQAIGLVQRVTTSKNGSVGLVEVMDGKLDITGSDELDVVWGVSCGGIGPKTVYNS